MQHKRSKQTRFLKKDFVILKKEKKKKKKGNLKKYVEVTEKQQGHQERPAAVSSKRQIKNARDTDLFIPQRRRQSLATETGVARGPLQQG